MIVNTFAHSQIPSVQFPPNQNFNLKLTRILGTSTFFIEPGIYVITSDLIQRSEGNPHRILDCILVRERTKCLEFTPTHSHEYKLNRYEINSPDIKIRSKRTDEELFFDELFISFEVRETYGRF